MIPVTLVVGLSLEIAGAAILAVEFFKPIVPRPPGWKADPFLTVRVPKISPWKRTPGRTIGGFRDFREIERKIEETTEWVKTTDEELKELGQWTERLADWVEKLDSWAAASAKGLRGALEGASKRRNWGIVGSLILAAGLALQLYGLFPGA